MWLVFALGSNVLWSTSDVISSILVRHHQRDPFVLAWYQSICELALLLLILPFLDVRTTWLPLFVVAGITAYAAFLFFFYVLHRIDVSVMNAAWAFLSLSVSVLSFLFLGESWSALQTGGVCLILLGVIILSFWNRHVSLLHTIGLFAVLGLLYAPIYVIQKAALTNGQVMGAVFFWPLLIQKSAALTLPLFISSTRVKISASRRTIRASFLVLCLLAVSLSLAGFFLSTKAYAIAPASLVSMTLNTQAFITIGVAYGVSIFFPRSAPRELLSAQSVGIKLGSFLIVFLGLALLSVPQ